MSECVCVCVCVYDRERERERDRERGRERERELHFSDYTRLLSHSYVHTKPYKESVDVSFHSQMSLAFPGFTLTTHTQS